MSMAKIGARITPDVVRTSNRGNGLIVRGDWEVDHLRGGRILHRQNFQNVVTAQGLNYLLDVGLDGDTPVTTWYAVGFTDETNAYEPDGTSTYIDPTGGGSGSTYLDGDDVAEAARQEWVTPGAAAGVITNSAAPAEYTADQAVTVTGGALMGADGTSGDASGFTDAGATVGYNLCAAQFASDVTLATNDVLKITITLTLADDGV